MTLVFADKGTNANDRTFRAAAERAMARAAKVRGPIRFFQRDDMAVAEADATEEKA